jgi:glucokinase
MTRITTCDIGGTHARFAIAQVDHGRVVELGDPVTLKTNEHASFELAWEDFARRVGGDMPRDLALAIAGPVGGEVLKLTNNPWVIRPAAVAAKLGIGRLTTVNDFGAIGHAVAVLGPEHFHDLCGPGRLPEHGVITIVGPGTGLGVAALLRNPAGGYHVIETEGGHIDFAPLDALEDRILAELREDFRRVSVERIVSGRGLWNIYGALCSIENRSLDYRDENALWEAVDKGNDSLAAAALDRLCLSLGAVAGDFALAQGAAGVVIAGGVGLRLASRLRASGFRDRFIAKGRFERRMDEMPVKLITHPQPGLLGAAAAFAHQHLTSYAAGGR